jgi:hypothetical protein
MEKEAINEQDDIQAQGTNGSTLTLVQSLQDCDITVWDLRPCKSVASASLRQRRVLCLLSSFRVVVELHPRSSPSLLLLRSAAVMLQEAEELDALLPGHSWSQ